MLLKIIDAIRLFTRRVHGNCLHYWLIQGLFLKRVHPQDFSEEDFCYAQDHLRLTSFCYGLLRPLDMIRPYRLEGDVRLPEPGNRTMFDYWKPILTDRFIADIKKVGGVLCNLASDEMRGLFDWKRVEKEVRVITPRVSRLEKRKIGYGSGLY